MGEVVEPVALGGERAGGDLVQERLPDVGQRAVDQRDPRPAAPAEAVAEPGREHEAAGAAADDHDVVGKGGGRRRGHGRLRARRQLRGPGETVRQRGAGQFAAGLNHRVPPRDRRERATARATISGPGGRVSDASTRRGRLQSQLYVASMLRCNNKARIAPVVSSVLHGCPVRAKLQCFRRAEWCATEGHAQMMMLHCKISGSNRARR
jgi:hypothetical protein